MDPPFLDTWWEFLGRLRHVPTMNFKHPEIQNMAQIRNANIGVRKARRASVENPKIYPKKTLKFHGKKLKKHLPNLTR